MVRRFPVSSLISCRFSLPVNFGIPITIPSLLGDYRSSLVSAEKRSGVFFDLLTDTCEGWQQVLQIVPTKLYPVDRLAR